MTKLELKVPPVAVVLIAALGIGLMPGALCNVPLASWQFVAAISSFIAGAVISVSGVLAFKKAQTTVNPMTPNASSTLVIAGIYNYSRNPMYVGMLLALLSLVLLSGSLFNLVFCVGFVLYMNQFQIKPEERALTEKFGNDYQAYCQRVKRWLWFF